MTWFTAFALFGFPLSVLALGWAAVLLQERSNRHAHRPLSLGNDGGTED
jgi:hypothetical protein